MGITFSSISQNYEKASSIVSTVDKDITDLQNDSSNSQSISAAQLESDYNQIEGLSDDNFSGLTSLIQNAKTTADTAVKAITVSGSSITEGTNPFSGDDDQSHSTSLKDSNGNAPTLYALFQGGSATYTVDTTWTAKHTVPVTAPDGGTVSKTEDESKDSTATVSASDLLSGNTTLSLTVSSSESTALATFLNSIPS